MISARPFLLALLLAPWVPGGSGQHLEGPAPGLDDLEEQRVMRAVALSQKRGQPEEPYPPEPPVAAALVGHPDKRASLESTQDPAADHIFVAVIGVCTLAGMVGLVVAALSIRQLHRRYKSAEEAEFGPQYGVTGPQGGKGSPAGDAKLANSAHLYHYQHTKQQIIAMEHGEDGKGHESDDSEGEGEEADYSVYECPGLAPTGDIEVSNPLFESGSPVPSPPASAKPPHAS